MSNETDYDAKIAREEARSLYNSENGVDAEDYRAHIDAFAPELVSESTSEAVVDDDDDAVCDYCGELVYNTIDGLCMHCRRRGIMPVEQMLRESESTPARRDAAIDELDRIIRDHHERMDACEYGSFEYHRLGYSMLRWQLQLERQTLNAEIEKLRQERDAACAALQKIAAETTPHPLYPTDPYHHGFGDARNAAQQIAEDGLIASNFYIRQLHS